jgi:hypothetical protein
MISSHDSKASFLQRSPASLLEGKQQQSSLSPW